MTIEEIQNSVLSILSHYIERMIYQRLSNANVIDPQHFGLDTIIVQLEEIAQQHPTLMNKATESMNALSLAFCKYLGYNILKYVVIAGKGTLASHYG